jgi:hypothetical protein
MPKQQQESRYLTRKAPFSGTSNSNNDNDDEKNAVLSGLLSDPTHESPPKRMKISTMPSPRSIKRRSFGEEIDRNNMLDAVNISMLSMESKDTAGTQLTEDTASDCATEVSSVAMLRGWLDDFGQKSKTHYVKNTVLAKQPSEQVATARDNKSLVPSTPLPPHHHAPLAIKRNMVDSKRQFAPSTTNGAKPIEQEALEKASKPPVYKSAVPKTPLPPHAPLAIKRNSIDANKKELNTSISSNSSNSSSTDKPTELLPLERPMMRRVSGSVALNSPTPLPYTSASALKRIMGNKGMTPVRIKPAYDKNEVQATDSGRSSVAKLSAWLADDPTTTKKVKSIRRGANVISKSRKFDKGLANVIVEQNNIRSGSVASKKQWLEICSSTEEEDANTSLSSNASLFNKKHSWLDGQRMSAQADMDSASAISVSDKKAWLNNAFKKQDGTSKLVSRAQTDVVTSQEERDDLSSRAKQMWRSRAPSNRSPVRTPAPKERSIIRPQTEVKPSARREIIAAFPAPKERSIFRPQTEVVKPDARREIITALPEPKERSIFKPQTEVKPDARRESITTAFPTLQISEQTSEQNDQPVNFHAARDAVVQRSKTNGKIVKVLSKVQIRKAKFEKLQKDNRRMSAPFGLLRSSWDEADAEVGPSNSYVKKFKDDIAPQKSFEELP